MNVILISGHAMNGKDTVASILRDELESEGARVLIAHFADAVKYVCKTFFGWNGQKDEKGRTLLQYVGTDVVRKQDPNFWIVFLADILSFFTGNWDYVLIPDTRFPNEVDTMRLVFDAKHLRVNRPNFESPLTEEQRRHPSETALDGYYADYIIENDGDLDKLKNSVEVFMKEVLYGREA